MEIGTTEAAARLGVTPGRVRQLIDEGSLPARKVGDHWLMLPEDVRAMKKRAKPGRPRKAKVNGR